MKGAVPWEFIVMVAIVDQLSISVLEIIATEEEEWLLREATDAAAVTTCPRRGWIGWRTSISMAWRSTAANPHCRAARQLVRTD